MSHSKLESPSLSATRQPLSDDEDPRRALLELLLARKAAWLADSGEEGRVSGGHRQVSAAARGPGKLERTALVCWLPSARL